MKGFFELVWSRAAGTGGGTVSRLVSFWLWLAGIISLVGCGIRTRLVLGV